MNSIISIICIADIHLGKLDPLYQWEDLKSTFFKYCEDKKPDMIVICGDIMHERVSVNNTTASIFHMFIDKLLELDTTILIIEGTKSHDDNQINMFSHKVSENFKIYKTVTSDYVHGLKLLIIPEEYMHEPEKYYKKYLKEEYDFCFGHGMFNHIAYVNKKKPTFRKLTAPIWDYDKHFKDIIHGRVVFGHEHKHNKLEKFYYVGSYGRYAHGEEDDKGFMHFEYDKKKKLVISEKFIKNEGAKIFKTVLESKLPKDRDSLLSKLRELSKNSFKLRIRIDREIDIERRSDIVGFCKKNLNVSIDNHYDRKKSKRDISDNLSGAAMVENKYENMDLIDATIEFVMENYDIKLDKDFIIKTLNSDD